MQKIYIVLTHTGTLLSNVIKKYTKNEYSHISIALDKNLENIYSFGRLTPYNMFNAGFVKESLTSGTFKRFKETKTSVYETEITDEQYEIMKKEINRMYNSKEEYKFNIIGLFLVMFNKKIKLPKTFYCAEFVRYILNKANINIDYLPDIIKPEDFKNLKNVKLVYKGKLRKYRNRIKHQEKQHIKPTITIPRRAAI